jgi:predicted ester cyclase
MIAQTQPLGLQIRRCIRWSSTKWSPCRAAPEGGRRRRRRGGGGRVHRRRRPRRRRVPRFTPYRKNAARGFYDFLTANFRTEDEEPLHRFFAGDTMILEQSMTGSVIGEMLGIPGNGRRVTFRILHVFDFRDGLVSREQVWIDIGAIVAQLTTAP